MRPFVRLAAPSLSLVLVVVLVACGPTAAPTSPAAPSVASAAPAPPEAPPAAPSAVPPAVPPVASAATSAAPTITSAPAAAAPAVLALTQGKVPDAARDLAAADEKVRKCLAGAKTPAKAGSLAVTITIATSGFTLNADAKPSGDVGKDVAACAKAALRDQPWGKPAGGGVAAAAGTFEVK